MTVTYVNTVLHFANIYLPPRASLENVFTFILMAIDTCPPSAKIVLAGDFNIDILQDSERQKTLLHFMQAHGFFFLSDRPTTDAGTLIDHFWSNMPSTNTFFGVLDTYWTDHYAACFAFPAKN